MSSSTWEPKSPYQAFFSFSAPFSLFPPNAVISLTDDNSTFFPARPAAFGPAFPSRGLSGQLWIGSGFADDNLQDGEGEGELGCSDVPGWEDGQPSMALKSGVLAFENGNSATATGKLKKSKRGEPGASVDRLPSSDERYGQDLTRVVDDGTDDYLHQVLRPKNSMREGSTSTGSNHADIQVIQETAEITGKIVLLSRGGCGFLDKVKWAQRRGAVALIVGDNQKGGPLIQMFARGNVDNVTTPSIFTSRTTAHLLSSLMHPGSFVMDAALGEKGIAAQKAAQAQFRKTGHAQTTTSAVVPAATSSQTSPGNHETSLGRAASRPKPSQASWVSRLFGWGQGDAAVSDRSRPPSSGRLDWVMTDHSTDETDKKRARNSLAKETKKAGRALSGESAPQEQGDNFQIGVQDWRDPDLVGDRGAKTGAVTKEVGKATDTTTQANGQEQPGPPATSTPRANEHDGLRGGSITPGSGEYVAGMAAGEQEKKAGSSKKTFDHGGGAVSSKTEASPGHGDSFAYGPARRVHAGKHDGLWVTIQPTGGASPFFDTLLVLVVSPLITLTVVYALLILRAKIRRRRWRAPKSVVEQLPVRTYRTVVSSPTQSPRLPSPTSMSPTTPLLQGRPRSRTVPESSDLLRADDTLLSSSSSSRGNEKESQWKKYMGRQIECVVCLEEYVDGVSRVMSLPCGHEFHAECITPWLTTRRRTCPICKGDVVRSLARGSPSSPRYEAYQDDSDEDIEATASGANQTSPPDVEVGLGISEPVRGRRAAPPNEGWFNVIASVGSGTSARARRTDSEERRDQDRLP